MELKGMALRNIGEISRMVALKSDLEFKKYDMQKGQFIFVTRICEHPGMNLMDLSRLLNVDKSTTTKAIQKLEAAGYVTKEHPEDNRKSFSLFPTARAVEVYPHLIADENLRLELCFRGFASEERKQVEKLLGRMCDNIEEAAERGSQEGVENHE